MKTSYRTTSVALCLSLLVIHCKQGRQTAVNATSDSAAETNPSTPQRPAGSQAIGGESINCDLTCRRLGVAGAGFAWFTTSNTCPKSQVQNSATGNSFCANVSETCSGPDDLGKKSLGICFHYLDSVLSNLEPIFRDEWVNDSLKQMEDSGEIGCKSPNAIDSVSCQAKGCAGYNSQFCACAHCQRLDICLPGEECNLQNICMSDADCSTNVYCTTSRLRCMQTGLMPVVLSKVSTLRPIQTSVRSIVPHPEGHNSPQPGGGSSP